LLKVLRRVEVSQAMKALSEQLGQVHNDLSHQQFFLKPGHMFPLIFQLGARDTILDHPLKAKFVATNGFVVEDLRSWNICMVSHILDGCALAQGLETRLNRQGDAHDIVSIATASYRVHFVESALSKKLHHAWGVCVNTEFAPDNLGDDLGIWLDIPGWVQAA
jgi:hypothetical protein